MTTPAYVFLTHRLTTSLYSRVVAGSKRYLARKLRFYATTYKSGKWKADTERVFFRFRHFLSQLSDVATDATTATRMMTYTLEKEGGRGGERGKREREAVSRS